MNNGYLLALVDPRDDRDFYIEWVPRGVRVNEQVADIVAHAESGEPTPLQERGRDILASD